MADENLEYIWQRLRELEEDLETLRVGRRILMRLVDDLEREHRRKVERLKRENRRLRQRIAHLSGGSLKENVRLVKSTE